MTAPTSSVGLALESGLRARVAALFDEGYDLWDRFDIKVRQKSFHPFVAADYDVVLEALLPLRAPGLKFLEWGSATGIITIMADLLGFEAYGIELDSSLVGHARDLARRNGSEARFAAGSFLPSGYRWRRNRDGWRTAIAPDTQDQYCETMSCRHNTLADGFIFFARISA